MSTAVTPVVDHSLSLWQLEAELVELMTFRESEDLTPDERDACAQQIREYLTREIRKVDGIRSYLRHCEVMAAAAKDESERQAARARTWSNRYDNLKAMCQAVMETFKAKRLEGNTGALVLKGNGGLAPLVIDDESLVPDEMCEYHIRASSRVWAAILRACPALSAPDLNAADFAVERLVVKKAVREALAAGPVAGARLEARGSHIEVK